MKPEEREELARLLPSPGDPVLPSDRHDLLKDHMMQELTVDVTGPAAAQKPAFRRRFAMIALPLAAATAVTAVVIGTAGSDTPTTDQEAVDLLNRIATIAAAKKSVPVRDDQYVYIRTQGSMEMEDRGTQIFRRSNWTAVDGKRAGLARITVLSGPTLPGHRTPKGVPEDMTLSPDPNVTTYRELEALPTDPDRLLEKIYADTEGQGPTREGAALETIGDMLDDATLLPELDAALYRAAAKIPGVRVVENAEDFAGRPGIGLSFKERDDTDVWVFDKKSLNYLGSDEEALLAVGVVDKIGDTPKS
ncbi:CU044_5270 family protein [Streptomyces albicerus]|uniref:CU044_5270 family protein n=1 Tax=Streptomyces albicerus TaxID=2569859 RepID=UPI00124B392D|nr:CU044_5270 family protein [Streptomyces albicerus]